MMKEIDVSTFHHFFDVTGNIQITCSDSVNIYLSNLIHHSNLPEQYTFTFI